MISGNKNYANEILNDIECYKDLLEGRMKRFHRGFWTKPWSTQSAGAITRYLLEERLKYKEEDIKTKVGTKLFADNKLFSLLSIYNNSPYAIINNAYPNRFKPWELASVYRGLWESEENIIDAVKWVVETKLDNDKDRVCTEFNQGLLCNYGMTSIARYGVYKILNLAYPNEFKPWELSQVPNGFWKDNNNVKEVVRWLVETKMDNDMQRVYTEINNEYIRKNGISGLLKMGLYDSINLVYPNKFKKSDFRYTTT